MNELSVAVVILTYNAKKLVLQCLFDLLKSKSSRLKITPIVVVNGSRDGTVKEIAGKFPKTIIIDNQKNYGFSNGINFGLKLAVQQNYNWILLLNDDVRFNPEFLEELVREADKNSYSICGPLILTIDNKVWSNGGVIDKVRFSGGLIDYGKDKTVKKNQPVDFISGTAMLVKKEVFEKIGFLDEDYFLYYDDVDFCFRAKKTGFNSYIVPSAQITHLETLTIKKNSASHYYHAAKSHLIFVFKRAPFSLKIREVFRALKTITELIKEKNKVKQKFELLAIRNFFLKRIWLLE